MSRRWNAYFAFGVESCCWFGALLNFFFVDGSHGDGGGFHVTEEAVFETLVGAVFGLLRETFMAEGRSRQLAFALVGLIILKTFN